MDMISALHKMCYLISKGKLDPRIVDLLVSEIGVEKLMEICYFSPYKGGS